MWILSSRFGGRSFPLSLVYLRFRRFEWALAEDASKLPKITDALLKKGYSEQDIEKILGGNILRVMEAVERAARPAS
ncbi:MAG: hypothetical protein DMF96_30355 [Acidobacteria bacterium]|nr:MAG: hypothetical protein DMF96_30355 [Acidobacteriota bacterium]